MTTGERNLIHWQYHMAGHFVTALFECFTKADTENLNLLIKAYPEEVGAFLRYRHEPGYWEKLKIEYNGR